jgi:hypothetical protein
LPGGCFSTGQEQQYYMLTPGQKRYLKGHGITEKQYDKMDNQSKAEWKDECETGAYKESYSHDEAFGRLAFKRIGGPKKEMQAIWDKKNKLIESIKKKHKTDRDLSFNTINQLKYILKNGLAPEKEASASIGQAILKIKG